jgi:hypothetical protein
MRKTNLALLVAIVVSSPMAFAYDGGGYTQQDPVSSGNNNTDVYKDNVGNKEITYT